MVYSLIMINLNSCKNWCCNLLVAVCLWFRPVIKWFLRRTTRLCEIQRICYGTVPGAERTAQIEFSLRHSRIPEITKCCEYLDSKAEKEALLPEVHYYAVYAIIRIKSVNTKCNPRFTNQLNTSIGSIWGYQQLYHQAEKLRKIKCSQTEESCDGLQNVSKKLEQLWNYLMPSVDLKDKITKQWQDIGFQGDNPTTDFRGTGLMGLDTLLYFASEHKSAARHVLSRSNHPQYGYSFAIVGINIAHMAFNLLEDGSLKNHFYNISVRDTRAKTVIDDPPPLIPVKMEHFFQVYCYLFIEFDVTWRNEKPRDIMEFSRIQKLFEERVRAKLKSYSVVLKTDFVLENV